MKLHVRKIAASFRACWLALLLAPQSAAQSEPPPASHDQAARPGEVVLTVTVSDGHGRYLTGLGKESFSITEGKAALEVTSLRELGGEPLSVAFVFDSSGSMKMNSKAWVALKEAAARLVALGKEESEYLVAEFGGEGGLRVLADWTRDRGAVAAGLNGIAANSKDGRPRPRGLTYWKDACADAVAAFARASRARRSIILFGDGGADSGSRTGGEELKQRMRRSGLLFYPVRLLTGVLQPLDGPAALNELASATGGRLYTAETSAQLEDVMERIALELREQYAVGFAPLDAAAEGEWSKVRVRVAKPKDLKGSIYVRSAGGYFSRGASAARRRSSSSDLPRDGLLADGVQRHRA